MPDCAAARKKPCFSGASLLGAKPLQSSHVMAFIMVDGNNYSCPSFTAGQPKTGGAAESFTWRSGEAAQESVLGTRLCTEAKAEAKLRAGTAMLHHN